MASKRKLKQQLRDMTTRVESLEGKIQRLSQPGDTQGQRPILTFLDLARIEINEFYTHVYAVPSRSAIAAAEPTTTQAPQKPQQQHQTRSRADVAHDEESPDVTLRNRNEHEQRQPANAAG